jgi:hypothetical protein
MQNGDLRASAAYHLVRGVPKRNPLCQRNRPANGKIDGAVLIAASIVAAILLRGEPIKKSPKVVATISESVRLARMVLASMARD